MASRKPAPARGPAKREAILAAAWEVFRQRGYAQASMDEITRRAGGSKVSVYAHFGGKQPLFEAVVRQRAEAVVGSLAVPETGSLARRLKALTTAIASALSSPEVRDLHRVALSARFEEVAVGPLLYEQGTRRVLRRIAELLAGEMAAGRLRSDSPDGAAEALFGLLIGASYLRFALGVPERLTPAALNQRIDRAVRVFLAAYERPAPSGRRSGLSAPRGAARRPA